LRLLPKATRTTAAAPRAAGGRLVHGSSEGATIARAPSYAPVLIAGRDAARRSEVRQELSDVMPAGTRFEELGTFWELLVEAPSARMVILSGEVDELSAESLLHTLAHRHPDLPVVSLETTASA
jgi:hypothetical protein